MKYYLCLDERGSFEHKEFVSAQSAVGGYLISQHGHDRLPILLESIIEKHNEEVKQINDKIPSLKKGDLHFRMLKLGHDPLKKNNFRYPKEIGTDLVTTVLNTLKAEAIFFCRSAGQPQLNLHPQHTYIICLISLIAGIIDSPNTLFKHGDEIVVKIASRSHEVLTGKAQEDIQKYQEILTDEIQSAIEPLSNNRSLRISFNFGSARKDEDLIFADFAISAMLDNDFRSIIPNDKKLIVNVRNYYHVSFGDRAIPIIENLWESGAIDDAMLLALDLSNTKEESTAQKAQSFIAQHFPQFLNNEIKTYSFANMFSARMEELLSQRYENPAAFEALRTMCTMVLNYTDNANSIASDRIRERALFYLVHWEAHSGKAYRNPDDSYTTRYDNFFTSKGTNLFSSLLARLERKLETKLIAVQTLFFNSFFFEELCSFLEEDIIAYEDAFKEYHKKEPVDDLYARLCGTYGQALAFVASMYDDQKKFETAKHYLQRDIEFVPPYSIYYQQGLSFLASLYWCMGNIEEMRTAIARELNCHVSDEAIMQALKILDIQKGSHIFIYLDWIRYVELCMRKQTRLQEGKILSIIDTAVNAIGEQKSKYPHNLFIKWAAVLHHRAGNSSRALKILGEPEIPLQSETIFDTIDPLIESLLVRAISGKGEDDTVYFEHIRNLANQFPGFARFAEKKGLLQTLPQSVDEISRLMPYYYA